MVFQTQFKIWCSRPSLEYGVAHPVKIMVLHTQLRISYVRIVGIFFENCTDCTDLKKMYGFFQKNVLIVRIFFFEYCTDCTDFFLKMYGFFQKSLVTLKLFKLRLFVASLISC